MRRRPVLLPAAVAACALVTGCTVDADGADDARSTTPAAPSAVAGAPTEPVTSVPGTTAGELALGASRLLHRRAPVAVVAADADVAGQALGAAVAVARSAPLLVVPTDGAATDLGEELSRLGTEAVLAIGSEAADAVDTTTGDPSGDGDGDPAGVTVTTFVPPPASSPDRYAGLADVAAVALGDPRDTAPDEAVALVAGWTGESPDVPVVGVGPDPAPSVGASGAAGSTDAADPGAPASPPLPATTEGERADGVVVLASSDPQWLAAAATARAAGAEVVVLDEPDPRTSPEAIAALADGSGPTVALGDAFGDADLLARRVATAATGVELPGGGQVLFPHRRFVALYGSPGIPALGSMGEQPVAEAIGRAQRQAAEFQPHSPEPVVPAFEIITTVASGAAGDDGDYSYPIDGTALREWVDAAGAAGVYVVLDLQPGRTDFLTQARQYEEYLREPHVGLALDSEWRLEPDQFHLRQIGSVSAAEVNSVAAWLAQLTADADLPQKLLLLHQFKLSMITERETLDLSHDELAVMIHADGFGTPGQKLDTWRVLRQDAPPVWWGWKNFYDEDQPTMTPEETMAIDPRPWFVSYQ